jgi:hypothetical protein
MKQDDAFEKDLASIHQLMERSVKFVSLSGLSGILAGTYALAGVGVAYFYYPSSMVASANWETVWPLAGIALVVLMASLVTGLWLSARKAKKSGVSVWGVTGRRLFINLSIPLVTGGCFCIICLLHGQLELVASATLIFYGLALINASPNLYDEVRYLGLSEIGLGLVSMVMPGYSLLFWAAGFGVLHIVYGTLMYRKYE